MSPLPETAGTRQPGKLNVMMAGAEKTTQYKHVSDEPVTHQQAKPYGGSNERFESWLRDGPD